MQRGGRRLDGAWRPYGRRVRSVSERCGSIVKRGRENLGVSLSVVGDRDSPGPATYLAVFYIILVLTTTRVDADLVWLTAVRAGDDPLRVGGAVAQRKLVVEIAVRKIDHLAPPLALAE